MMLFSVLPTAFEVGLVLYVLSTSVGASIAGVSIATMAAYILFTMRYTSIRTGYRRKMNDAENRCAGLVMDSITNAEPVRHFTTEDFELRRYQEAQEKFEKESNRVTESLSFLNFGQQLIFSLGLFTSMCLTSAQVATGLAPVGSMVLVTSLLFQLSIPLNFVGSVYRETRLKLVDMQKLHDFLMMRPKCGNAEDAVDFKPGDAEITFEGVSFNYSSSANLNLSDEDEPDTGKSENYAPQVISDLSFTIPARKKVAIVGPSGCGKSTLIKLLTRTLDPSLGNIFIDGQNIKALNLKSFREHIGVVAQDTVLFNDTILFNLQYGRPEATLEEVEAAAKIAQIHSTIKSLEKGYATVVGERGLKLSGGEKQRINLARCILRNPQIVLFDEATSSLDVHTEQQILQAFQAISEGRTSVVIAHRLSTILDADKIIFFSDGKIQETGTHKELLQIDGRYAEMWHRQVLNQRSS
eukprot:Selendium_serpulae@DN5505_c0_g2_i1.p1